MVDMAPAVNTDGDKDKAEKSEEPAEKANEV